MTLNPGLLARRVVTRDVSWADPLIAARYHRELGNGFGVTGYADVGGFDTNRGRSAASIQGRFEHAGVGIVRTHVA